MASAYFSDSLGSNAGSRPSYPFVEPAVFEIIHRRCLEWRPRMQQHRELVSSINELEPKNLNNYFELNQKRQEADQILLDVIRDCNYRIYHLVGLLAPDCQNPASIRTEIELEQQLVEQCLHQMYNQGQSVNIRQQQNRYYRSLAASYHPVYDHSQQQ